LAFNVFAKLGEIYEFGLVDNRILIISIMYFVPGTLLQFLGKILREESNWTGCKDKLLDE
jgi:hypothetical protein